jgi:hypothetical protein
MPAHKHAHLMAEYAKDALETDRPWERWEVSCPEMGVWITLGSCPSWNEDLAYRRKPRTININGYEVPEPVREPLKSGDLYFIASLEYECFYSFQTWAYSPADYLSLERGLVHLTQEAAVAHAKALLSLTKLTNDKESQ